MHFSGGINRPPYETADGYLQTTEGCSHNHCLFCTYFKEQIFRKSTMEEIEADIKEIPATFGAPKRIFLQGADGFAADYDVLMKTAELLRKYVPSVETDSDILFPAGSSAIGSEAQETSTTSTRESNKRIESVFFICKIPFVRIVLRFLANRKIRPGKAPCRILYLHTQKAFVLPRNVMRALQAVARKDARRPREIGEKYDF